MEKDQQKATGSEGNEFHDFLLVNVNCGGWLIQTLRASLYGFSDGLPLILCLSMLLFGPTKLNGKVNERSGSPTMGAVCKKGFENNNDLEIVMNTVPYRKGRVVVPLYS